MNSKNKSQKNRGVLRHMSGKTPDGVVKLRRDATIFGREKGDIIVDDSEVSSTHCQIQEIGGIYHIFDMNSTNGTFVNNERVLKAKLKDGDVITLGQSSFRFSLEDESEVRHITTIFKAKEKKNKLTDSRSSLVDTLIESELHSPTSFVLNIKIAYDDGSDENVELSQQSLFIGRASSFGKFEADSEISRKHLLVKVNNTGEVFIEDQGSTNGSYLNGKRITGMHMVRPQDEVRVGTSRLWFKAKSA